MEPKKGEEMSGRQADINILTDSKGGRTAAGETSVRVAAELTVMVDGGRWWWRWADGVLRTTAVGGFHLWL